MKSRFLFQCILPATVVLGFVCGLSIYFSRLMACQNMMSALTGQQVSKMKNVEATVSSLFEESTVRSSMGIIESVAEGHADPRAMLKSAGDLSSVSSVFTDIYFVVFDQHVVKGSKGFEGEFTGDEYWYDSEKIARDEWYTVDSTQADERTSLFTCVRPVINKEGKPVGAILYRTNDQAFIPMIQITLNMDEQVWFIINEDGEPVFTPNPGIPRLNELASVASSFDNSTPYIHAAGVQYIMRVESLGCFKGYSIVFTIPVGPIVEQSRGTMLISVLISLLSIFMIAFAVLSFSKKMIHEINDVRKSVKGISENDFSEPIEAKTNDEMGMLVKEFNGVIDKLKYQAEHDGKTSFYNSEAFAKKSVEYIAARHDRNYAIVRVDIDNFSFINDIFDWSVGDSILLGISQQLSSVFGSDAVYGYLGNDIFVICTGFVFREAVIQKIERANEKIKESAEKYMPITPHFGIVENAEADMDISILCDYAGIALKTIKGNLLQIYALYDEKFDENHKVQKFVESNKIAALENNDFYILLQPKCDIFSGEVVGAEALVRWRDHTSGEVISPGKFIPIFEKNGFVITLDKFVWEETCKVIKKWRDLGYKEVPVSVNVSRMHIIHDTFVEEFAELVAKYDIPPHLIEVEITESALLENSEDALQEVMQGLKKKGFKLLMDDFASGYSSLIALQRLPFDVIKVDKGLIDKIGEGFNREFVAGIIAFLQEIKKDIVIEGVEYDWQKEILKNTGGRVIQGFCFSRPISVSDFEKLAFGVSDAENEEKDK